MNKHTPPDMNDSHDEYSRFIKEQMGLMLDTTVMVQRNGLNYHKKHCVNPTPTCEEAFMMLYLYHFSTILQQMTDPKESTDAVDIMFMLVDPPSPN